VSASWRLVISGALLVGATVLLQLRTEGDAMPLRKALGAFPRELGEWRGQETLLFDDKILGKLKTTDYLMRRYVDAAGRVVWLYVGYWDTQRKGAHPHSPQNCLPGSGWEPLEASRITVSLSPPLEPITINSYLLQKDRQLQLVLYWYDAQGRAVAGEIPAKIEMLKSSTLRNRTDGALIRVSSMVHGSVAETSERLLAYVRTMYPTLREHFPA
jgi:EpsI family protein